MNIQDNLGFVKSILKVFNTFSIIKQYGRQIWSTTWPMLVTLVFDFMMNLTDVLVAGLLGKQVQAAVGMTNQVYYFSTVIIYALSIGTISVISRIFGSQERDKELPGAIHTSVVFAAAISIILTVIVFFVSPIIIQKMNMTEEVRRHAFVLMRMYTFGLFFHLMAIYFNAILRACKLMLVTMKVLMFASVLNIVLNLILVFKTPLGFAGISLSTAISWCVAAIILFRIVWKMSSGDRTFYKPIAKRIFHIGWPSGIVSFSWHFASVLIFSIVGSLPNNSTEVMAALTAGLRIESMIFMPAFAFNMANAVIVGTLLGEKKPEEAFRAGIATNIIGVAFIIMLTVIVVLFANPIAHLLASKDEFGKADPAVVSEILRYIHIVMLAQPFIASNLILSGALNGAGDTRALMRYAVFSVWVVRMPAIYITGIVFALGPTAMWWSMNATFFVQAILSGKRFLSKRWINLPL